MKARLWAKLIGVLAILWLAIHGPNLPGPTPAPELSLSLGQVLLGVIVVGAMLLVMTGIGLLLTPEGARPVLRGRLPARIYLASVLALLGVSFALEALTVALDIGRDGGLGEMGRLMASLSWRERAVAAFAIGVGPGLTEELCFRGWLLTRLTVASGPGVALVVSSVAFGLFHFDPMYAVVTALMGMTMGWTVLRTGSLFPAILAHTINNGLSVFLAGLLMPELAFLFLGVGLLGGIWGWRVLLRETPSGGMEESAFHASVDGEDGSAEMSSQSWGSQEDDRPGHVLG